MRDDEGLRTILKMAAAAETCRERIEEYLPMVHEHFAAAEPDSEAANREAFLRAVQLHETDPTEAEWIVRAHFGAGNVDVPVSKWRGVSEPEPILWRDTDKEISPVLSVGEIALLSASGGLGKSTVTLAVAAAATAKEHNAACGLRTQTGPVSLVSYEDAPSRIARRLSWMPDADFEAVHLTENPAPLWDAPEGRGAGQRGRQWPILWSRIRENGARLVIIDPASAACLAPVSEATAVRAFLGALEEEAKPRDHWPGCGVWIVAHSTKSSRDALLMGQDPGAGVVAGSAAWYDGARGVLTLYRGGGGDFMLHCVKSNYGQVGWGQRLHVHQEGGRYRGLRAVESGAVHPDGVADWLQKNFGKKKDAKSGAGDEGLPGL